MLPTINHLGSETKGSPIMSVLHHLEDIPFEVDLSLEVGVMHDLHWNLACSGVLLCEIHIFNLHVSLQPFSGKNALLVNPGADSAHDGPIRDGDGERKDDNEDPVPSPRIAESKDPWEEVLQDPREEENRQSKVKIVEGGRAFCWQGGICDGLVVGCATARSQ